MSIILVDIPQPKWQGKGLQNPHRRFDSAPRLQLTLRLKILDYWCRDQPPFRKVREERLRKGRKEKRFAVWIRHSVNLTDTISKVSCISQQVDGTTP